MRTAAELDGVLHPALVLGVREHRLDVRSDGNDANDVGVLLPEHGTQGADLQRLLLIDLLREDLLVGRDLLVDQRLDALQLRLGARFAMREVKSRLDRIDQGAIRLHAWIHSFLRLTEHFSQRPVEQVRRGVVLRCGAAMGKINLHFARTGHELSRDYCSDVHNVITAPLN